MRKETRLGGKLVKLYTEELGGTDFVSLNFYGAKTPLLKSCEMAEEKVIRFIREVKLVESGNIYRQTSSISSSVAATHSPRA